MLIQVSYNTRSKKVTKQGYTDVSLLIQNIDDPFGKVTK